MKKENLKDLDIITLRNKERLVLIDGEFIDLNDDYTNDISELDDFRDDLTCFYNHHQFDVIKVERTVISASIWEREEKAVKMTVSEVCEKLGYDVEIVKEKDND